MKKAASLLAMAFVWAACTPRPEGAFFVRGVSAPTVDLNGVWKIQTRPSGNFWDPGQPLEGWKDIRIPGEAMMQGFPVRHDEPFALRRDIEVPADFAGCVIKLRFEGVYSYARVWVNGIHIRDHSGGFTAWECDITSAVEPGTAASLTVEVTDRADEISYASGYAKHPIGGILRGVSLTAAPVNHPEDVRIVTDLDDDYRNARLTVMGRLTRPGRSSEVRLELRDRRGKKVGLANGSLQVAGAAFAIENLVAGPEKWDAEHPILYRLGVSLVEDGELSWSKEYALGFREVEVRGNRFLVNGRQVKLRGACRHDIHPLLGRVSTPEYELKDVLLAKDANINFIRTSHYPPTESFLSLCDEHGLYVEDETAVCFVGSHRTAEYAPGASESSAEFTERYLSQLREMVGNHRNHPSVIIWSIGNENAFGTNFKKSYDWVKADDPTRPVVFSYPGLVPEGVRAYDILSMHYPGIDGSMEQYNKVTASFGHSEMPVIFDEWAHVACYNRFTVREDPNVRDFWGQSLDRMWRGAFEADGGLGGSIWGMVDETFMLPEELAGFNDWWGKIDRNILPGEYAGRTVGYGEWGIVDTWRREKPEFWNTKKAYSPVKVLKTAFESYRPGQALAVPVQNRFDHTNMDELKVIWTYGGRRAQLVPPEIAPHGKGDLMVPLTAWDHREPVLLEFFDGRGRLIDSCSLRLEPGEGERAMAEARVPLSGRERPRLSEDGGEVVILCDGGVEIRIDRTTGLFTRIGTGADSLGFEGPYLHLRTLGRAVAYSANLMEDQAADWRLESFSAEATDREAVVRLKGDYASVKDVSFTVRVGADATVVAEYTAGKTPPGLLRECGVKFLVDDVFEALEWKRAAAWSVYPARHLSAAEGRAPLYADARKSYRRDPAKAWALDTKSFFYDGTADEAEGELTHIARATKEDVREYDLLARNGSRLSVIGEGLVSCRIARESGRIGLIVAGLMDYPDLAWGNYQRNIPSGGPVSGAARVVFRPAPGLAIGVSRR